MGGGLLFESQRETAITGGIKANHYYLRILDRIVRYTIKPRSIALTGR
jgi:hypothetical protein